MSKRFLGGLFAGAVLAFAVVAGSRPAAPQAAKPSEPEPPTEQSLARLPSSAISSGFIGRVYTVLPRESAR